MKLRIKKKWLDQDFSYFIKYRKFLKLKIQLENFSIIKSSSQIYILVPQKKVLIFLSETNNFFECLLLMMMLLPFWWFALLFLFSPLLSPECWNMTTFHPRRVCVRVRWGASCHSYFPYPCPVPFPDPFPFHLCYLATICGLLLRLWLRVSAGVGAGNGDGDGERKVLSPGCGSIREIRNRQQLTESIYIYI